MHTEKHLNTSTISEDTYTTSFDLYRCSSYSYQIYITSKSSPTGAYIQLQASNGDSLWNDVTGARINIANDANENICMLEDATVTYRYIRLKLAITSGSFDAKVIFNAQEGVY